MTRGKTLLVAVIMPLCVCNSLGCTQKNTTCNNVKAPTGFRFLYDCATGIEVSAYYNQTSIAHADFQKQNYEHLPEVKSIDNSSVVTKECRDLRIQCISLNGNYVTETCEEFQITENLSPVIDVTTPWGLIIGVSVGVILIIGVIGMSLYYWKKELKHDGRHDDWDSSGEDNMRGNEQDNTNVTVHVDRNLRDDPGGVYTLRTVNMNNGCTHGDRGPEGQVLLLDQRAAVQGTDMTGEAVALVNKNDFDPDQISRCSTAQVIDAESVRSAPQINNRSKHKY